MFLSEYLQKKTERRGNHRKECQHPYGGYRQVPRDRFKNKRTGCGQNSRCRKLDKAEQHDVPAGDYTVRDYDVYGKKEGAHQGQDVAGVDRKACVQGNEADACQAEKCRRNIVPVGTFSACDPVKERHHDAVCSSQESVFSGGRKCQAVCLGHIGKKQCKAHCRACTQVFPVDFFKGPERNEQHDYSRSAEADCQDVKGRNA